MKRVIISGATGAIGMALIEKCIKENTEVVVLTRPESKRNKCITDKSNNKVTLVECNLNNYVKLCEAIADKSCDATNNSDRRTCDAAKNKYSNEVHAAVNILKSLGDFDVFYHLAWNGTTGDSRNNMQLQNENVKYALDAVMLANALGCKGFIGAGSQAEYGRVDGVLSKDTPVNPENGYGMAKLCAGQMTRGLCAQLSMNHIWVRILSIYGPYDNENSMVISTIRKLLRGEIPPLTKGEQQWDYLYSADAAKALYRLGVKACEDDDFTDKIYCLGSGESTALSNYIKTLRDAINPELELGFGEIPYSKKQVMHLVADISELTRDIGFIPETNFENGIRSTIDWVKSCS